MQVPEWRVGWIMLMNKKHSSGKDAGYTLVELSISIAIIAILLIGGLTLYNKVDDAKRTRITVERQAVIKQALTNFVLENKYLPCPATGNSLESQTSFGNNTAITSMFSVTSNTISAVSGTNQAFMDTGNAFGPFGAGTVLAVSGFASSNNNGTFTVTSKVSSSEIRVSGTNSLVDATASPTITILAHECGLTDQTGMLPLTALKLADEYAYDGWGRKFTYRIGAGMGNKADFTSNIYLGDLRVIDISGNEKTDMDKASPNNMGAAYVVVSHGPNGQGAWLRNNATAETAPASTSRELENTDHSVNKTYVQNERVSRIGGVDAGFDDIVLYQRKSDLLPQVYGRSPTRIPTLTCTNAGVIIAANEPSVSTSNVLGAFNTAYSAIAAQVYSAVKAIKMLCDNQPSPIQASNQSVTNDLAVCGLTPHSVVPDNLQLWLDANDIFGSGNLPQDGYRVSTWYDKSGNLFHATQSVLVNRPTFKLNIANGKPVIRFDDSTAGQESFLYAPKGVLAALSSDGLAEDLTVFVVAAASKQQSQSILLAYPDVNSNRFGIIAPNATSQTIFYYGDSSGAGTGKQTNSYGWVSGTFSVFSYASSSTAATMNIYQNGTLLTPAGTSKTPSAVYALSGTSRLDIGRCVGNATVANSACNNTSTTYFSGDIAEIIIYNTALSDDERENIENYLKMKWGTAAGSSCPEEYLF
jgi:prepilin-type N-terminal cleavage/methylation domain-containing protein